MTKEILEEEQKEDSVVGDDMASGQPSDDDSVAVQPENPNVKWYIVQCYTGQEYKVQARVLQLIEDSKLQHIISRVLVPEEETIEIKNNKRVEKIAKIYPGYLFVQMEYDDGVYFAIRSLPGVAKFVGTRNQPTPVVEDEILRVLRKVGDKTPKVDVDFEVDEVVKVISGPFRGYSGQISEINAERGTLKALISIFGRETPVKLDFDQVEKVIE